MKLQDPIAVANYIVNIANKNNKYVVTNLKLQKILFFLQGFCLKNYNQKLIDGQFEKWQYGPVQKKVYRAFRMNGASAIKNVSLAFSRNNGYLQIEDSPVMTKESLEDSEKFTEIEKLAKKLLTKPAWQLVEWTHKDPTWNNYIEDIQERKATPYTDKEIKSCYTNVESQLVNN